MKVTQETSAFYNPCTFWLAKQLRHTTLCTRGKMHLPEPDNPSFTKQEQAHPWGTAVLPRRWRTCPESTQTGVSSSGRAHQSPPSPPGLQQRAASCSAGPRTHRHKARCKARFVGSHRLLDRIPGRVACGSACVWARPLGRGGQAEVMSLSQQRGDTGRQSGETPRVERPRCPAGKGSIHVVPKCLTQALGEQECCPCRGEAGRTPGWK